MVRCFFFRVASGGANTNVLGEEEDFFKGRLAVEPLASHSSPERVDPSTSGPISDFLAFSDST